MKNKFSDLYLTALFFTVLTGSTVIAADNTPPAQATPGTPASMDSKTQHNDPSGPNHQTTASTSPDSKMDRNAAAPTSDTSADQSKPSATKTPQKDKSTNDGTMK